MIAFGTWFFASEFSWAAILAFLALFVLFLVLGSFLNPPFWWGKRRFTTPLTGSSHWSTAEAHHREGPRKATARPADPPGTGASDSYRRSKSEAGQQPK